jgi:asparagine synthetase B (glutamine-hydrolysing)
LRWRAELPPVPRAWQPSHVSAHAPSPVSSGGATAWWHDLRALIEKVADSAGSAHFDRLGRRFGLEIRQPFLDARLVNVVLRMPPDAFYRGGVTKWIFRSALHDVLPPLVRDRTDKGSFAPLSAYGLRHGRRRFVEALLIDSELERRGFVDARRWAGSIRRYLEHPEEPPYWAYWRSLTVEMWLRAKNGRLPDLN